MNDTDEKCSQTDLVNPQLAHNDVVHCGGNLPPHIVVPAGVELQVNGTWGGKGDRRLKEKRNITVSLLPIDNCKTRVIRCSCDCKSVCEHAQFYLQQLKNIMSCTTFMPCAQAMHFHLFPV